MMIAYRVTVEELKDLTEVTVMVQKVVVVCSFDLVRGSHEKSRQQTRGDSSEKS